MNTFKIAQFFKGQKDPWPRAIFGKVVALFIVPLMALTATVQADESPFGLNLMKDSFNTPGGAPLPVNNNVFGATQALISNVFSVGVPPNLGAIPPGWTQIDPNNVHINGAPSNVMTVWQVGSNAGFNNSFGYNANGNYQFTPNNGANPVNPGSQVLLFPSFAVHDNNFLPGPGNLPVAQITVLPSAMLTGKQDFFLIANGANYIPDTQYNVFWTNPNVKGNPLTDPSTFPGGTGDATAISNPPPDQSYLNVYAFLYGDYILYAWEDIPFPGTDGDYNDAFFLVKDQDFVVVPEPGTYLLLGSMLLAMAFVKRRRMAKVVA